jgi:hypothetical protein
MQRKLFSGSTASPGSSLPPSTTHGSNFYEPVLSATGRAVSPSAQGHLLPSSAVMSAGLRPRPRPAGAPSGQAPSWLPPGASLSKGSAAHRAHRAASVPYQRNQRRSTAPPNDRSPTPSASHAQSLNRWPTPPPPGSNSTGSSTGWVDNLTAVDHITLALPQQGSSALHPQERLSTLMHWAHGSYGEAISQSQTPVMSDVEHTLRGTAEKAHPRPALAVITNTPQGVNPSAQTGCQRNRPSGDGCAAQPSQTRLATHLPLPCDS